jgi:hypothetical protein
VDPGYPFPNSIWHIYLWHDGGLRSISPSATGTAAGENINPGINRGLLFLQSRVSPDGHHLLFSTNNGEELLSGHGASKDFDHGACLSTLNQGCRELYAYDATTDTLSCPSCNASGTATLEGSGTGIEHGMATDSVQVNPGAAGTSSHHNRAISDDGRFVFFSTAERLVSEDTNGVNDAYVYDTATATPHLLSSGTDEQPSYFLDASPDGKNAFFSTAERLSAWDTDTSYDAYDARIEGGFPEPSPTTAPCNGDSCRAPAPAPPAAAAAGSATFAGPGNPRSARCPKGKRQVRSHGRTRCVAKKHRKAHKRAGSNRGGAK